jgi:hypothetical protein
VALLRHRLAHGTLFRGTPPRSPLACDALPEGP